MQVKWIDLESQVEVEDLKMNVQSSKNVESKAKILMNMRVRALLVSTGDLQVAAVFPSKRKVQEVRWFKTKHLLRYLIEIIEAEPK